MTGRDRDVSSGGTSLSGTHPKKDYERGERGFRGVPFQEERALIDA